MTGFRRHFHFFIPLFLFAYLGISLNSSLGMFAWKELICISILWVLVLIFSFSEKDLSSSLNWNVDWVFRSSCLLLSTFLLYVLSHPGIFPQDRESYSYFKFFIWIAFLLSIALTLYSFISELDLAQDRRGIKPLLALAQYGGLALIATCLFLAKIFTIRSVPHPFIDVFTTNSLGAKAFVAGFNPYLEKYPDIYGGTYDYPPGYVYWPGVLYLQAIAQELFGDIRYAFVFADLVTFFCLREILKEMGWSKYIGMAVPTLWLAAPAGFFILQQSWVDTLLIGSASLFLFCILKNKKIAAGLALGYFCSIKQYSIFFGILALLFILFSQGPKIDIPKRKGPQLQWKNLIIVMSVAASFFLILVLPFALWDWTGFYFNTIYTPLTQKMRMDSLSWVAGFARLRWMTLDGMQGLLISLVSLVGSAFWITRHSRSDNIQPLSLGLVAIYGATFLFGKQAFCNYYYLLSFFVLLLVFARPVGRATPD